jgi:hypothetical protein
MPRGLTSRLLQRFEGGPFRHGLLVGRVTLFNFNDGLGSMKQGSGLLSFSLRMCGAD